MIISSVVGGVSVMLHSIYVFVYESRNLHKGRKITKRKSDNQKMIIALSKKGVLEMIN